MADFSVASLRVVREVVDRGSFTDAARRLGYTQSAVSRQVALCTRRDPIDIADELGGRGTAALKALVTDAVNEQLRPLRPRRRKLAADPGYLQQVLAEGSSRANDIADHTLHRVREVMDMAY